MPLRRCRSMGSLVSPPEPTRFTFTNTPRMPVTPTNSISEDEGLGRSPTDGDTYNPSTSIHLTPTGGGDHARRPSCRKSLSKLLGTVRSSPRTQSLPLLDRVAPPDSEASITKNDSSDNSVGGTDSRTRPTPAGKLFENLQEQAQAELAAAYFNTAIAASQQGAVNPAIENYEAAAKLGHTKSKVNLAQLYFSIGDGTVVQRAKQLLAEACHERDSVALAFVGAAYRTGTGPLGVRRDPARACRILRAAVKLGNPDAMLQLSLQLSAGDGVERSDFEALELCKQAAPFRAAAQRRLAQLSSDGRGNCVDQHLSGPCRKTAKFSTHVGNRRDSLAKTKAVGRHVPP